MASPFVDTEKILKLLGTGLSTEVVATAVGCDPSYISQLMADESFRQRVIELRLLSLTGATSRDQKYDALEDQLLDKLNEVVNYISKPREVISALVALNKAERRGAKPQEQTVVNNRIVNLMLPPKVALRFITNSNQQIVAVNGESMVTMPSDKLPNLLENMRSTADETKRLPTGSLGSSGKNKSTSENRQETDDILTKLGAN